MTTVNPTAIDQDSLGGDDYIVGRRWALTTANPDGAPVTKPLHSDRTFVATGTWGGATLTIEGSADGATYVALKDVNGSAATLSANGAIHIQNVPRYMRPNLTTVGAGATVAVDMLARRATDLRT